MTEERNATLANVLRDIERDGYAELQWIAMVHGTGWPSGEAEDKARAWAAERGLFVTTHDAGPPAATRWLTFHKQCT